MNHAGRARWFALVVALGLVGALLSSDARAARVVAVLSASSEAYQEVSQAMRAVLEPLGHRIDVIDLAQADRAQLADALLIVGVGVRAAEKLAGLPGRAPVLVVLVPRQWYLDGGRAALADDGRRHVSAITVDQPAARQAALIRLAFPEARRVGLVVGPARAGALAEIEAALRARQLETRSEIVAPGSKLVAALERVLAETDLMLALPDPTVLNADTAQLWFLTSYRHRDPVVGYSRSLSHAGALVSLYSSPAQIGRQAAEWLADFLSGDAAKLPELMSPCYFEVMVNTRVARSLGRALPQADALAAALERLP